MNTRVSNNYGQWGWEEWTNDKESIRLAMEELVLKPLARD